MSPSVRSQHPSPEELDALLDPAHVPDRRVRDHVGRCEDCRDLLDGMRQVRRLLHEEGLRPVSMPPRLQARLEDSITALSRTDGLSNTDRLSGRHQPHPDQKRDAVPVPRWLSLAAGLVVLAGTGLAASQLLGGGENGFSSAGGASSSTATGEGRPSVLGGTEGGSVPTPAPSTWGPVALPPRGVTASSTRYTAGALPSQVRLLLSATAPATADGSGAQRPGQERSAPERSGPERFGPEPNVEDGAAEDTPDESGTAWLADPGALGRCMAVLGAPERQPLAVDVGSWEGRPAAVVVVPDGTKHALAAVVEPPCTGTTDLLYRARVER